MSHVERNREYWTGLAPEYAEVAPRNWGGEPHWGVWHVPESELRALPEVAGKDVIELGCGTAYFSGWLARMGARPVGVDVTPAQLETARAMQREFGLEFPLVEASAEDVPLPDASFDLVLSEYGASIWCDPYAWVPEAARLLRPGGELVFLVNGTLLILCAPDDDDAPVGTELVRPYYGLHRLSFGVGSTEPNNERRRRLGRRRSGEEQGSVEFHLGYGDWIRLLRANGFEVLDLIEVRAPEGAPPHRHAGLASPEWARQWPSEEIWRARKIAA